MTRPEDVVAQAIRVADGGHTMGAGELGEVAVKALRDAGYTLREPVGSGRSWASAPTDSADTEELLLYAMARSSDELDEAEVARVIRWYYTLPGCATGGSLHIVLDDYNCDDDHIEWCEGNANGRDDTCGVELAGLLRRMGAWRRVRAIMLARGDVVDGVRLTDDA